jgi:hypothetical protein
MTGNVNESAFSLAVAAAQAHCDRFGFPPSLDDATLNPWDILLWEDSMGEDAIDELVSLCEPHDPATRSVVAATLYLNGGKKVTDDDAARQALVILARAEDVEWIPSVGQLRWELHLAVMVHCVDRALALVRRLMELDSTPAMRSHVSRALFLALHPQWGARRHDIADLVDPLLAHAGPPVEVHRDMVCYVLATSIDGPRLRLAVQSDAAPEALLELDQQLDRLRLENGSLTPTEESIHLWSKSCTASADHNLTALKRVGEDYLRLQPFCVRDVPIAGLDGIATATTCFAAALEWQAAADAAARWAEARPDSRDAYRYLTEARFKQGDAASAFAAFEKYVRLSPEPENDWHSSLTIELGLNLDDLRKNNHELKAAALAHPVRSLGESLTEWFWPRFSSLSQGARTNWWLALFDVASPEAATGKGDDRWSQVAAFVGVAVELELKAYIFAPFVASVKGQLAPSDKRWQAVVDGSGMLGELIECLLQSRRPQTDAARRLSEWLTAHQLPLVRYLDDGKSQRDLDSIRKLRASALHKPAPVTPNEVRRVYAQATRLIDAIDRPRDAGSSS